MVCSTLIITHAHNCTHPLFVTHVVVQVIIRFHQAHYSGVITFGDEDYIVTYAMAVSFGKLEEFDTANGEDWVQYIERMEHFFSGQ